MNKIFHVLVREDGIKLACHLGCVLLYEVVKGNSEKVCVLYLVGTPSCRNAVYDYADGKREYNEDFFAIDEDFDDDDAMDIDHSSVLADWTFATDRKMIQEEFKNSFWKAIDMLSPESREVVDLLMRDIPYDIMADILGCSEGAVRVRVYRARKELKRYNVAA